MIDKELDKNDHNLLDCLKFGSLSCIFSIALKYDNYTFKLVQPGDINKTSNSYDWLNGFYIKENFFQENCIPLNIDKIQNRINWEKDITDNFKSDDYHIYSNTVLSLDIYDKTYDELLYMIYARKSASISLEKSKNIYIIKLKSIKNIPFSEDLCDKVENRLFNVGLYAIFKKTGYSPIYGNKFSPFISLCAIIEPSAKSFDKKIYHLNKLRNFPYINIIINKQTSNDYLRDINKYIKGESENRVSFENFALYIFIREFMYKINNYYVQHDYDPIANSYRGYFKPINLLYIKRSHSLISWTIAINNISYYTMDPLRSFLTSSENSGKLNVIISLINMLFPGEYDPEVINKTKISEKVLVNKIAEIKVRFSNSDTIVYTTGDNTLVLLDFDEYKKSIDEIWSSNLDSLTYDYTISSPRWSIAWDFLISSMITSQELLFISYDERISITKYFKNSKIEYIKEITEQALSDFEEHYDMDMTSHENSSFRKEYENFKIINHADLYYSIFKEKLSLLNAEIIEEQNNINFWILILTLIAVIIAIIGAIIGIFYK